MPMPKKAHYDALLADLAAAPVEKKEEELSIAELASRRLLRQREAADREARIVARRLRRADAKMAKSVALEAREYLEELERARWEATKQEREYAEMIAEMERKTKRYFDVTDKRKGTTTRTGGVYFGDHIPDGDAAWVAHGWGELRLPTGEIGYEGEWRRGQRHGRGTLHFENGDYWAGEFIDDQARGVGFYHWQYVDGEEPFKPRSAVFHAERRRAWLDDLIPGRRLKLEQGFWRPGESSVGTVVGKLVPNEPEVNFHDSAHLAADNPRSRSIKTKRDLTKFYVNLDDGSKTLLVDLAVVAFELLPEEHFKHRVEGTQSDDTTRFDYERSRPQPANFFTLVEIEPTVSLAETVGDAEREAYEGKTRSVAATNAAAKAAEKTREALKNQAQLAGKAKTRRAAFEARVKAAIDRNKRKEDADFHLKLKQTFLPKVGVADERPP